MAKTALILILSTILYLPVLAQTSGKTVELNGVTVSGRKSALKRQADRLVVNISGNRLYATAVNALDVLKKLPGLEVGGDGVILMSGRITPVIFIDGKPVPMSPEELQNYLASLSPDMIASIEVINNPSSRYDGEYKGIIDIRLKRDMTLGWKGTATGSLQQNAYTLSDNHLLLSYKTKKLAYTGSLDYMRGNGIRRYEALQHLANTNIMATNTGIVTAYNNLNYSLGADYSINKNQRLSIALRSYRMNRNISSFNTLHTTDATALHLVSHTHSYNIAVPKQQTYAANLGYTAQFGKKQLEVLGTLVQIDNGQHEDFQHTNTGNGELLDHWKTLLQNDILIRTVQADLADSLGKGKLRAGAKFAFTTTKNDLRYDTLNTRGLFILDSSRTNDFQYDEYISAAYISYEGSWNKLSYTLSLRAEHTRSIANSFTQGDVTTRDYLTWLPGLNLTYVISSGKQLNFSYSRRMTRPTFGQLNPFRFYNSPLNYYVGNPYLQPSTTQQLNIAYTWRSLNISLFGGRESDPMTRYPEYDSATNILEYLGRNLPYNDFAGIEVSFPLHITKWWTMQHNIRGAYKKELTPYHGVNYNIPITDYTVSGSQTFTLPQAITFDISYYYHSLSGNGLYIIQPIGSLDLGLRKTWMKGQLNTRINFYDILNTNKIKYIFREKRIINNELGHWFGNRKLVLTLSYNFGNSTHKARQRQKNEEESRAGM
jgi:outer membrane receptor protein involved in Fe transport